MLSSTRVETSTWLSICELFHTVLFDRPMTKTIINNIDNKLIIIKMGISSWNHSDRSQIKKVEHLDEKPLIMAVVIGCSGKSCRGLRLLRRRWNAAGSERRPHVRLQIDSLSAAVGSLQQPPSYWAYAAVKHFHSSRLRYITFHGHRWQGKKGKKEVAEFYRKSCRCVVAHWALCLQPPAKIPAVFDLSSRLEGGQQEQQGCRRERGWELTVRPRPEVLVSLSDITRGQSCRA